MIEIVEFLQWYFIDKHRSSDFLYIQLTPRFHKSDIIFFQVWEKNPTRLKNRPPNLGVVGFSHTKISYQIYPWKRYVTHTCWKSRINCQHANTHRIQHMSALFALNKQIPMKYRKICQHVVNHARSRAYGTHEYSLTAYERHGFLTPTKYWHFQSGCSCLISLPHCIINQLDIC